MVVVVAVVGLGAETEESREKAREKLKHGQRRRAGINLFQLSRSRRRVTITRAGIGINIKEDDRGRRCCNFSGSIKESNWGKAKRNKRKIMQEERATHSAHVRQGVRAGKAQRRGETGIGGAVIGRELAGRKRRVPPPLTTL